MAVVAWSSRLVGGVEDYVSRLLPAMHRAGVSIAFWHEVDTPSDRSRIEVPCGVRDICAAEQGLDKSIQQLREWKPDVLYVQGVSDVRVEAKLLDIAPAVLFLHTYIGTCISGTKTFSRPTSVPCARRFGLACLVHYFPHGCGGNDPRTMWRLFGMQSERLRLLRRYTGILTHSDHMRDEMKRHGLSAHVVPYPCDVSPSVSPVMRGSSRTDSFTRTEAWRLLFAGRMEDLKGGHYLIEALPEVTRAARRPVRVVLAGDGRDRKSWEAAAQRVQAVTANLTVEFTGWVTAQHVTTLMRDADLLVVPSLWPEPLGSVGPMAAQHGLPAAAFDSGGIPQWLADGVSGQVAPSDPPTPTGLARAIVRCLADPAHYAALRKGATGIGARFTMARHLPTLTEHLARVDRR